MKSIIPILILFSIIQTGCSAKHRTTALVGIGSAALGAGVGYAFVHHGKEKEYQTTNTIITSSIFGLVGAGITYWHLSSLEKQKLELASQFSQSRFLDDSDHSSLKSIRFDPVVIQNNSVELDASNRWVLPQFRKRDLPAQRSETEIISPHYTWEIARPGFFINKKQDQEFFNEK